MKFTYNLSGIGWAKGKLIIKDQGLDFTVSYLSDPLADLLNSIVKITPLYANGDFSTRIIDNEATFLWEGEPWGYRWAMKFNSFDDLHIKIFSVEDVFEELSKETLSFDVHCNYYEFVNAVIVELLQLLNKYGFTGYYDIWDKRDFPVASLLKLVYFLKKGAAYWGILDSLINATKSGDFPEESGLDFEIGLLKSYT